MSLRVSSRRAASLLEFALTLPLLVFLFLAVAEMSWVLRARAVVTSAVTSAGDICVRAFSIAL